MPVSPAAVKDLAPTGKLRVAINLGNMVLAQKDDATGEIRGVTAELARFLPCPTVERDGDRFYLDDDRPDSIGKLRAFHGVPATILRAYAAAHPELLELAGAPHVY